MSLFSSDPEGKKRINLFLAYMTAVRKKDPAGNDISETLSTRGRTGGILTLYREIFLVVVPKHVDDKDIMKYVHQSFQPVLNDVEIQSCYHMQYMSGTENKSADEMLSPIRSNAPPQNGKYWAMLDGALKENYQVEYHEALNKVLTSDGIATALQLAGNISVTETAVKAKSIPDGVKLFVYGDTTAEGETCE